MTSRLRNGPAVDKARATLAKAEDEWLRLEELRESLPVNR